MFARIHLPRAASSVITLLLCLSFALSPYPASAQTTDYGPTPNFVLVTWNIQSGQSDANVIARQMALFDGVDIWLLQEVNKKEVAILEAGAEDGEDANFTSVLSSAGDGNHLLVIYDDDRFDADAVVERTEVNIGGRVRPMLNVVLHDDSSAFVVANNHLYSSNTRARFEQAAWLQAWAAQQIKDAPVIAAGDMNFEALSSDPAYVAITTDGLWERIAPDNDGPTRPNGRAIDHIFVLGTAQQWPVSAHIVERENDLDNEQNSDHRPVLALVGSEVAAPLVPCSTLAQECLLDEASPTAKPSAASTIATVTAAAVNLRGGPGTTYAIVGSAKQGDAFAVIGKSADGSWLELDNGAWIAGFLVSTAAAPSGGETKVLGVVPATPTPGPARAAAPVAVQPTQAPAAPAQVQAGALKITQVDKRAEYVVIRNVGGSAVNLAGWVLVSEKGNQRCALSGVIEAGASLTISALGDVAGYNCGFGSNIWNNSESDPAVLLSPDGKEVSRY